MKSLLLKWFHRSVFSPIGKGAAMESVLAAVFHRASATVYAVYALWSTISAIYGVPSLITAKGVDWQVLFSIIVVIATLPAAFGATFWPSFARLEAFSGTFFVGLILLYIGIAVSNIVNHVGTGSWSGIMLLVSILALPAFRCSVVMIFLVRQAREREQKYIAYVDSIQGKNERNDRNQGFWDEEHTDTES